MAYNVESGFSLCPLDRPGQEGEGENEAMTLILDGQSWIVSSSMDSDFKNFIEAVREMREAQAAYFKIRDQSMLARAKTAEAAVDAMVRRLTRQADLFKGDQS